MHDVVQKREVFVRKRAAGERDHAGLPACVAGREGGEEGGDERVGPCDGVVNKRCGVLLPEYQGARTVVQKGGA